MKLLGRAFEFLSCDDGDKINSINNEIIENRFNSHLIEYVEIVGVVIIGKVQDTVTSICSDPFETSIPIRYASWFHLIFSEFGRHLGCEWEERWKLIKVYCLY